MRDMGTGVIKYMLATETILIFDVERTIIDTFRYLSKEIALKAMKKALQSKNKVDIPKLLYYAKKFRINIQPYLLAVLA
jgi:hypothetical protein